MFNDEGIIIFLKENHPDIYDEIEKAGFNISNPSENYHQVDSYKYLREVCSNLYDYRRKDIGNYKHDIVISLF